MKNDKSPKVDGLDFEFYKSMWQTIGDDFNHIVLEVFSLKDICENPLING